MLSSWGQGGGLNAGLYANLSFLLPLNDAGAGAVNLVPLHSLGSNTATFTRATAATCWGPTGLLLTVGTGVARFTYTELTGSIALGYLCEEARTNSCIQNRDFTNAAWVKTTMTAAKDQIGIDGVAGSASSLLATAGNATAAQTVTIAAVNRPFSIYVKRLVGTGNIDLSQDGAAFTTQTVANDGLWHRCTLVASQLNPVLTIRLATNADKIAVDYAMLEDSGGAARTFVLSPIATTTVAVTRNVDVLSYPGASNVSNSVGTAYLELTEAAGVGTQQGSILQTDVTTNGRVLEHLSGQATTTVSSFDGTNTVTKTGITDRSLGTPVPVATTWTGTTLKVGQSTAALQSGTFDTTMGDGSKISIGISGANGNALAGTIRGVKLWTRALSDTEVATL